MLRDIGGLRSRKNEKKKLIRSAEATSEFFPLEHILHIIYTFNEPILSPNLLPKLELQFKEFVSMVK